MPFTPTTAQLELLAELEMARMPARPYTLRAGALIVCFNDRNF